MIKPEEIINHVCAILNLDKKILIAEQREQCPHCNCRMRTKVHSTPKYVDGRQIICLLIRKHTHGDCSYREIAEMLGRTLTNGKGDHAFAIYSETNAIRLLKAKNKAFTAKFKKCEIPKKISALDQSQQGLQKNVA